MHVHDTQTGASGTTMFDEVQKERQARLHTLTELFIGSKIHFDRYKNC